MADPGRIPGPKVVPSCAEIQIYWAMPNARNASIIIHGRYTGAFAITQAQIDAFFTAIVASATASGLTALQPTSVGLSACSVKDINTANQAPIFNTSTLPRAPGISTGLALPPQVALVVTLRTAFSGQANRGRSYIPGWADNAVLAAGVATPAATAAAAQFMADANTAMRNNLTLTMVIAQVARAAYTGRKGTQHPARPANSQAVVQTVVRDNIFDTQRRRSRP